MSNENDPARSILEKLTRHWMDFEMWPEGNGWVQIDGNAELSVEEVAYLSTIKKPDEKAGPGGLPADWGDAGELD